MGEITTIRGYSRLNSGVFSGALLAELVKLKIPVYWVDSESGERYLGLSTRARREFNQLAEPLGYVPGYWGRLS